MIFELLWSRILPRPTVLVRPSHVDSHIMENVAEIKESRNRYNIGGQSTVLDSAIIHLGAW